MCLAAWQAAQGAIGVSGPLEVAMRNSPTLGHAYRYCAQRLHAHDGVTQLCLEKFPSDARIFVLLSTMLLGEAASASGSQCAGAHSAWHPCGQRRRGARVRGLVTHRPLAPLTHFNATVRFGPGMNALLLDERDFERRCRLPIRSCTKWRPVSSSAAYPKAPVPLRTRARIRIAQLLADGNCAGVMATILQLHRRTLQRKLRREGESFETLRDSVRRDIAHCAMQQSDIPLMHNSSDHESFSGRQRVSDGHPRSGLLLCLFSPRHLGAGNINLFAIQDKDNIVRPQIGDKGIE